MQLYDRIYNQELIPVGQIDPDGFLTIKLRLGALGVLEYSRQEIDDTTKNNSIFPSDKQTFRMLRDENSLFSEASIATLLGKYLLAYEHEWIVAEKSEGMSEIANINYTTPNSQVGTIAGEPFREGDFLVGYALITDPRIIESVKDRELIEISPAYESETIIKPGVWNGEPYDIIQGPARYNHIVLLRKDEARGGNELRILNKKQKGVKSMTVAFTTDEGVIQVSPDSQYIVQKLIDSKKKLEDAVEEEKEKNEQAEVDSASLQQKIADFESLKAQLADKEAELMDIKAKLDEAISPAEMGQMMEEATETEEVLDRIGDKKLKEVCTDSKWQKPAEKRANILKNYFKMQDKKFDEKKFDDKDFVDGAWMMLKEELNNRPKIQDKKVPASQILDSNAKVKNFDDALTRLGFNKEG